MEYSIEELLPLVEKLTKKYTLNDSSSITYETARMLMGAILYCIEEFRNNGSNESLMTNEKLDAELAYQRGYDMVVSKVYKAKEIYESILDYFHDFECRNYKDTIIKGIPCFFLKYDPKFNPQDHILTLDYPTIKPINNLCGIDAIYQYLCNVKVESQFLYVFDTKCIINLLERVVSDYKNLFCDNISKEVLLTALGCIIAKKPVGRLELKVNDIDLIQNYFDNEKVEIVEEKIQLLITKLIDNGFNGNMEMEKYFQITSNDYAIRIVNGIKHHTLCGVFSILNH